MQHTGIITVLKLKLNDVRSFAGGASFNFASMHSYYFDLFRNNIIIMTTLMNSQFHGSGRLRETV